MTGWQTIRERIPTLIGSTCLVAAFLLLSPGVRVVQAGDPEPSGLVSTDPALIEATESGQEAVAPPPAAAVAPEDYQPGVPAIEVAPGVVVLNTRGFNYGPPPTPLDPAALQAETLQK